MAAKVGQNVQYQESGTLYAALITSVDAGPPEKVNLIVFSYDANLLAIPFISGVEEETAAPPVNDKWNVIPV